MVGNIHLISFPVFVQVAVKRYRLLDNGNENYKKIGDVQYRNVDWNALILNDAEMARTQINDETGRSKSKAVLEKVRLTIKSEMVDYSDDKIDNDLFQAYVEHCEIYDERELKKLFGRLFS